MSSGFDDLARSGVIGSCTPVSDVASGKLVLGVVIRTRAALCFFLFFLPSYMAEMTYEKRMVIAFFPPFSISSPPVHITAEIWEGRLWRVVCGSSDSQFSPAETNLCLQGGWSCHTCTRVEKAPLFSVTPITHPAPSAAVVVLTKAIQMGC